MAATTVTPAAPASAPAAASSAPAASPAPAASAPAPAAAPATPATPAAGESQSLEQRLQDTIKKGFEQPAAVPNPVEDAAAAAAAAAEETAPGEPAESAAADTHPSEATQTTPEGQEWDDFESEPSALGPKELAAKIDASPELKAALASNPEVKDLLFANSRLAAKAKPFLDMFGSPEEAQAVVEGHQNFAQVRSLMGAVKRDDFGSTQTVLNAMMELDAMRDEDGNPLKNPDGSLATAGNMGRLVRNLFAMKLATLEAQAKQSGDNETLAALDLIMERSGLRAPSSAVEGETEELKAQRTALEQERSELDQRKASERRQAVEEHEKRTFDAIGNALDTTIKSLLDRADGLTPFARTAAEAKIRTSLQQAVQKSPGYQTELDRIERMPIGQKREKAHVALAQRYLQSLLRNVSLPILKEAGITLGKKAAATEAAQAARAEAARSEVAGNATPSRATPPKSQAEARAVIVQNLTTKLGRAPTLEEVIAERISPAFARTA